MKKALLATALCLTIEVAACAPSPEQRVEALWAKPPRGPEYERLRGPVRDTARVYFADPNAEAHVIGLIDVDPPEVCALVTTVHGRWVLVRGRSSSRAISEDDTFLFRSLALSLCQPIVKRPNGVTPASRPIDVSTWAPQTTVGQEAQWGFKSFADIEIEIQDRQYQEAKAASLGRASIEQRMVAPGATFSTIPGKPNCGLVTSKNRLGVLVRQRYVVVGTSGMTSEDIGPAAMDALWEANCN